jgi:tetratricopeptide (TPR) repeat protein
MSGAKESALSEAIHRAEQAFSEGRRQLDKGRPWDAIQRIEAGLVFAKGTAIHRRLRVLLAQALAQNPRWLKRAEETLLGVIQEDPQEIEAYVALSALYRTVGINSRARAMITRALALDPSHPHASAELRSLDAAGE